MDSYSDLVWKLSEPFLKHEQSKLAEILSQMKPTPEKDRVHKWYEEESNGT